MHYTKPSEADYELLMLAGVDAYGNPFDYSTLQNEDFEEPVHDEKTGENAYEKFAGDQDRYERYDYHQYTHDDYEEEQYDQDDWEDVPAHDQNQLQESIESQEEIKQPNQSDVDLAVHEQYVERGLIFSPP